MALSRYWQEAPARAKNVSDVIEHQTTYPDKRPYFHRVSAAWAAIGALTGATAASARVGVAALLLAAAVASWTRLVPRQKKALVAFLLFFALGAARGAYWSGKWVDAEAAARAGPCEVLFLPVGPAVMGAFGDVMAFRARAFVSGDLEGDLVEVTAHARDKAAVSEGVPVRAYGRFALAQQAMNPGDFDLRRQLSAERTFATFECSRLEPCGEPEVPWRDRAFPLALGYLRSRVSGSIERTLPPQEAAVLRGVLLSDRSGLSYELSLNLRRSGFYRFVTIAGFHVDLAFLLVEASARRLTRRPTASRLVAAAVACLYASLSGWTPGAIRAFTCALMRAFAAPLRRRYYPLAGLSVAGLVCAWAVPFPLTDPGFQLSFVGALGGFAAGRYLPRSRRRLRSLVLGLARVGVMAAFLFPVAASSFSDFAVAGFILGGLWAGAVSALIPLSVCLLALPLLGRVAGWLPYLVIRGAIDVSSFVSAQSLSALAVPAFSAAEMAGYYGLLLVLATMGEGRLRVDAPPARPWERYHVFVVAACSVVLLASATLRVYMPWPEVTFISVGQADCALVRYKTTAIIVDTGTPGAFTRSVSRFLRRLGIRDVELCVLSHLHQDHSGGFAGLCGEVRVGSVLTAAGTLSETRDLLPTLTALPTIVEASPGATYTVGDLVISALCPPDSSAGRGDENDRSMVLLIGVLGRGAPLMEFWGDAPMEMVSDYMSRYPSLFGAGETVRVVKVPHHGSRDALAPGFFPRLSGSVAVISVGTNSYGHPSKEVLDAAAESEVRLYRTDLRGAVTASFLPFGATFRSFR